MYFMPRRGFTLIELLVVIAIIGILAAIVLSALGTTRQQSADGGIKANLNSIRTQSYVYESNNGTYGSQAYATAGVNASCGSTGMWTSGTVANASKAASNNAGTATLNSVANQTSACFSTSGAWFIAVVLKTNNSLVWCVDSVGRAGTTSVTLLNNAITASATTCP
jgi:prepilin-type N-terminal cleavage/methylation domain-containing protein